MNITVEWMVWGQTLTNPPSSSFVPPARPECSTLTSVVLLSCTDSSSHTAPDPLLLPTTAVLAPKCRLRQTPRLRLLRQATLQGGHSCDIRRQTFKDRHSYHELSTCFLWSLKSGSGSCPQRRQLASRWNIDLPPGAEPVVASRGFNSSLTTYMFVWRFILQLSYQTWQTLKYLSKLNCWQPACSGSVALFGIICNIKFG